MHSSLISYTNISKHKTSPRNHTIDRFTPHCIVGWWTSKKGADYFATTDRDCSANYVIGKDGDISLSVDENDRSWCSSNSSNDNRAITVECASNTIEPYDFTDKTYNSLVDLCVDVCKRYNKNKLVFISNKDEAIKYEPKAGEMQLTLHRFFSAKSCPGDWFISKIPDFLNKVNERLGVKTMDKQEFIIYMSKTIKKYNLTYGFNVVSSILAQAILESNYGTSELAVNANNYFGLKHRDGRCPSSCGTYVKVGSEQNKDGSYSSSTMIWERFNSIDDCVKGYFEFLTNAGGRYNNLKGVTSPDIYCRLIKDDGYATSLDYVSKLLKIIDENNLRQYDSISVKSISIEELKELQNKINALIDAMI